MAKMKKVGILTLHFSINYGAVLQCMSLQKYLTEKDNDVFVIDYVPDYLREYWNPWISPLSECKKRLLYSGKNPIKTGFIMIKTFFFTLLQNKDYFSRREKFLRFKSFTDEYIRKTGTYYSDIRTLESDCGEYDIIISGSDQVWNPLFTKGKVDDVYLLNFGDGKYKKASYAASAGISDYDFIKQLAQDIRNIQYISVREKSLANALNNYDKNLNVKRVIDPTLLLSGEDWRKYKRSIQAPKGKYIFVYCLKQHEEFAQVLELLKCELNYVIVDLSPLQVDIPKCNTINASKCGPGEFLSYIDEAAFVVTNSFHATVFSILFKKEFITIPDNNTGARMIDLLEDFELADRIFNPEIDIKNYIRPVNYENIENHRQILKSEADIFLDKVGI